MPIFSGSRLNRSIELEVVELGKQVKQLAQTMSDLMEIAKTKFGIDIQKYIDAKEREGKNA